MTDTGPWTGSAWWADLARTVPLAGEVAGSEVLAATDAGLDVDLMTDGFVMELVSAELMFRVRAGDPAARDAMIALGTELEAGRPVVSEDVVSAYLIHVPSPASRTARSPTRWVRGSVRPSTRTVTTATSPRSPHSWTGCSRRCLRWRRSPTSSGTGITTRCWPTRSWATSRSARSRC